MPFTVSQLVGMVTLLRDLYVSLHFEKQLPHFLQRAIKDLKPSIQVASGVCVSYIVLWGQFLEENGPF